MNIREDSINNYKNLNKDPKYIADYLAKINNQQFKKIFSKMLSFET